MSQDTQRNIAIDPATGRPPIIETEDGTFRYTLPDDCRMLWKLGVRVYQDSLNSYLYDFYNRNLHFARLQTFTFRDWEYYEIPADSVPRLPGADPSVIFSFNPLDTDDIYHIFYYAVPREILSATTQPQVEEQYHDMLMDGVMARIGKKEYGDGNDYEYWKERVVKREYCRVQNRGQKSRKRFVTSRPVG